MNLFKGYKAVTYQPFLDYLQFIKNGHKDGSAVITAQALMTRCANFYKNKLTRDEWEQPSETQQEMLALPWKVKTIQKQVKTLHEQAQTKTVAADKDAEGKPKVKQSNVERKVMVVL